MLFVENHNWSELEIFILCLPTVSCTPCSPSQLADPACNNVCFTGHLQLEAEKVIAI
jgi:hypothetical protein